MFRLVCIVYFLKVFLAFYGIASESFVAHDDGIPASVVDDQELTRFLTAEGKKVIASYDKNRRLSGDGGIAMDRCGNRNPCANGFECRDMPIGNRCMPNSKSTECISEAVKAEGINGTEFMEMIFDLAGVSEEELILARFNARDDEAFSRLEAYRAVMAAANENRSPMERVREIHINCTGTPNSGQTMNWEGLHVEFGALLDFSYTNMNAIVGGDNSNATYARTCLGAGPLVLGHVSLAVGFSGNTNNTNDLACASLWTGYDAVAGLGFGLAVGIGFNGMRMAETTWGYGAGLGAGVKTCAAWRCNA